MQYHISSQSILDIGKSAFASALKLKYECIDTLGLQDDMISRAGTHYKFDLNNTIDKLLWRSDIPKYDIIIFAEVIEHLYISPNYILKFLHSILNKDGFLFLQTPNAVALHKRIKMLFGINPYELIRENVNNPGHYREYTKKELINYLEKNGFSIESCTFNNYFDYRYSNHRDFRKAFEKTKGNLVNHIYSVVPKSLKPGIFIVAKRI